MKKKLISSAILLTTAIIWGFAFVAQVQGMETVGSFTYNGIRFFIGSIVMIPALLIFSRKTLDRKKLKRSIISGLLVGTVLFIATTLQQYSIEFNPDQNSMKAGFITGLYAVLVPVLALIFFKKKTGLATWIGVICATVGLCLLCVVGSAKFDYLDIVLFISAIFWALHILSVDKFGNGVDIFAFSSTQYAVCAILSIIGALIFDRVSLNPAAIGGAILPILYGGALSVGVAFTLQFIGQKNADPTVAAIILSTESMFGAIGNLIFFSVNLTFVQYIGCVFIFIGIIVAQLNFKRKKSAASL